MVLSEPISLNFAWKPLNNVLEKKMDLIDLDEDKIEAEVLDAMAVS
jgi:F0F1-type ATP synthase membrane subunit b/b'